jgi:hypothetical protein
MAGSGFKPEPAKKIMPDSRAQMIATCASTATRHGRVTRAVHARSQEIAMSSFYDELCEKLKKDPRLTKRGGARYDLGLLLFNARDSLRELWDAADSEVAEVRKKGHQPSPRLEAAVEELRPIFGGRS